MLEEKLNTLRQASKFLWELADFEKPELVSQMPHYIGDFQGLFDLLEGFLASGSGFSFWLERNLSPSSLVALEHAKKEALHKIGLLLQGAKYLASGRDVLDIPPPKFYTQEAIRVMGELFELSSLAIAKGTGVVATNRMASRLVKRWLLSYR